VKSRKRSTRKATRKSSAPFEAPIPELDLRAEVLSLFKNVQDSLPRLKKLLAEYGGEWVYEDFIYRFYHQSFKVFGLQQATAFIVAELQSLAPDRKLNEWFMQIIKDGTGKTFADEDNNRWLAATRPIVEAFFHARYFIEMAVRYGEELKAPPTMLPSGWAALLYLYNLR
jgi:hypothetical protein